MTAVVRVLACYVELPDWAFVAIWCVVCIAVMGALVALQTLYARLREARKRREVDRKLALHRLAMGQWRDEQRVLGYVRLYRAIRSGQGERA